PIQFHAALLPARVQRDEGDGIVRAAEDRGAAVRAETVEARIPLGQGDDPACRSLADLPGQDRAEVLGHEPAVVYDQPPAVGAEGQMDETRARARSGPAGDHRAVGDPAQGDDTLSVTIGKVLERRVEREPAVLGEVPAA